MNVDQNSLGVSINALAATFLTTKNMVRWKNNRRVNLLRKVGQPILTI